MGIVILLIAAVLSGCGGDDDGGSSSGSTATGSAPAATQPAAAPTAATAAPTTAPAGGPISVTIADFNYTPSSLNVRAGQQVSLSVRNGGQFPHTFTIDGVADSARIDAGATKAVQFTPAQAGSLTFYCTIHGRGTMSGQITVSGGASGAPSGPIPGGTAAAGGMVDYVY
jgi:plastocyanin